VKPLLGKWLQFLSNRSLTEIAQKVISPLCGESDEPDADGNHPQNKKTCSQKQTQKDGVWLKFQNDDQHRQPQPEWKSGDPHKIENHILIHARNFAPQGLSGLPSEKKVHGRPFSPAFDSKVKKAKRNTKRQQQVARQDSWNNQTMTHTHQFSSK
jgi:hypothetical protein